MVRELAPVPFRGVELPVFADGGCGYVSVTAICRVLELNEQAQRRRIRRHELLREGGAIMATPSPRGAQETFCLRLDLLHFWLATIQPTRVASERRDELIAFQRECANVLFQHFVIERQLVLGTAPMREWRAARRDFNRKRFAATRFRARPFGEFVT